MKTSNQKGFSLFELIVVIIIVSVLTGLALPRYFNMIKSAMAPEALHQINVIRQAVLGCFAGTNNMLSCRDLDQLSIENPNNDPAGNFKYYLNALFGIQNGIENDRFIIIALLAKNNPGGESLIFYQESLSAGETLHRCGFGAFKNINNITLNDEGLDWCTDPPLNRAYNTAHFDVCGKFPQYCI